jgi:hypothetical protein
LKCLPNPFLDLKRNLLRFQEQIFAQYQSANMDWVAALSRKFCLLAHLGRFTAT